MREKQKSQFNPNRKVEHHVVISSKILSIHALKKSYYSDSSIYFQGLQQIMNRDLIPC